MTPTERAVDRWLSAIMVNFGGEQLTRAEVFAWFEAEGYPRRAAELWLIGNARGKAVVR